MTYWTKALLLVAAGILAACSNTTDPFGSGSGAGAGGLEGLGSPGDPTSVAYFQQSVGDRVLFVVDTSNLTPEAQATLREQAQFLMANGDYTAIIEGHADERGTRQYNIALGEARANSAREFLVSQGVAASRLQVVSYGKERPLEICSEDACYAQNRRAVTVLGAGGLGS